MTEYLPQAEMWVYADRLREAEARIAEMESMLRDNPTHAEMDAAQFEINRLAGQLDMARAELTAARRVVEATEAWLSDGGPWTYLSEAVAAYRAAYRREK